MNGYLKQSTAGQVRTIGPFVDDTDFKTLENALTINNTDIVISINGGADTVKNSGGATAHGAGGIYTLTWDATDTASIGELYYSVKVAGALVVFGTYVVLDEAVYDALFGTTALATATNITAGTITTVSGNVNGSVNSVTTGVSIANGAITTTTFGAGAIDAAAIAANAIGASELATDAAEEIADTILGRNVAGGSNTGRLVKEALYALRNKVAITAGTMTVYQTDDTTSSWTGAVSTTAGDPISTIDPA